jgi:hypothetical protein
MDIYKVRKMVIWEKATLKYNETILPNKFEFHMYLGF